MTKTSNDVLDEAQGLTRYYGGHAMSPGDIFKVHHTSYVTHSSLRALLGLSQKAPLSCLGRGVCVVRSFLIPKKYSGTDGAWEPSILGLASAIFARPVRRHLADGHPFVIGEDVGYLSRVEHIIDVLYKRFGHNLGIRK